MLLPPCLLQDDNVRLQQLVEVLEGRLQQLAPGS
jgi:hypothetical protein